MTTEDEVRREFLEALEGATVRGDGWVSLPTPEPLRDVPLILEALREAEVLDLSSVTITPSEVHAGWWDILLVRMDELPEDPEALKAHILEEIRKFKGRGRGRFTPYLVNGKPQDPAVDRPPGDAVNHDAGDGKPDLQQGVDS